MCRHPAMCRICLAMNGRMFSIAETPLQTVYEKIVDCPLHTTDARPLTACYICYAQLKKCHNLMVMAARSEKVLTEISETYPEVSARCTALMNHQTNIISLSTIPVEYYDTSSFNASTCGYIRQECDNLKNELEFEEVEYKESMDPEVAEYDIDIVKCESDMNVDTLWQTGEVPELDTEIKVEVQEDNQEDFVKVLKSPGESSIQDMENQPEEIPDESKQDPQDSTTSILYQCECLRVYTDKTLYRKHLDVHQIHECKICKHRFSNRNNLKRHMSTHSKERPYQCKICGRRFRLKHYLKCHVEIHNKDRPFKSENYKCHFCRRVFRQKSALTSHLRTHTGEKPFECDECQRKFASKFNLQTHLRMHSGEKPFACDVCAARFIYTTSLKQHKMTHTGERPHTCHVCRRGFTQRSHLKDHLKSHNNKKHEKY